MVIRPLKSQDFSLKPKIIIILEIIILTRSYAGIYTKVPLILRPEGDNQWIFLNSTPYNNINCFMKPSNQKYLLADIQIFILNKLRYVLHTCTDTHTEMHSVLKFRKQVCQCTRQTDGQTDCQPHCVSMCSQLLVFIPYSYIYILCLPAVAQCCPALTGMGEMSAQISLWTGWKERGGRTGGLEERRRHKEKGDL